MKSMGRVAFFSCSTLEASSKLYPARIWHTKEAALSKGKEGRPNTSLSWSLNSSHTEV